MFRSAYDLGKMTDRLERLSWDDRLPSAIRAGSVQGYGRQVADAADRLAEAAVRINPVTSDQLATPKRSRRGHRRSPEEVLEATLPALGGLVMVFTEITVLNLTPEDAHEAKVSLDKAIRSLTRIKSLI